MHLWEAGDDPRSLPGGTLDDERPTGILHMLPHHRETEVSPSRRGHHFPRQPFAVVRNDDLDPPAIAPEQHRRMPGVSVPPDIEQCFAGDVVHAVGDIEG